MSSMPQSQQDDSLPLRNYLLLLRRRWWYIFLPLLATVIGALVWTSLTTPIYYAEVVLRVDAAAVGTAEADPFARLYISRDAVLSLIEQVRSAPTLQQVATNLDLPSRNLSLGKVTAKQIGRTEFFLVSVKNPDPVLARDVANEVARVVKTESEQEWARRLATARFLLQFRVEELQKKISATRQTLAAAPGQGNAQLLQLQLSQYESQYATALGALEESQIVESRTGEVLMVQAPATIPTRPVYPKHLQNILLAVLLGAFLGIAAAVLREYFDNTTKSPEDVQRLLGAPVMGAVPILPKVRKLSEGLILEDLEDSPRGEPYYTLHTNLQFSQADNTSQLFLVTSSQLGEGKTTTTVNLGIVMAKAGKRVVLVDADLRRPQIHAMLGLPQAEGLGNILLQDNFSPSAHLKESSFENLSVLTAGSRAPNPAILLGSERMQELLEQLMERADVVLLDSPPVLYVSDALTLAGMVERVLLVIGSGMVRKEAVQRSWEALEMVKAKQVDMVLNKISRETAHYSYYHYNYYSSKSR